MRILLSLFVIFISTVSFTQSENELFNIFKKNFQNTNKLSEKYDVTDYIKPHYLISDFNGDNDQDIAILIINKQNKKRGFIIYHPNTNDFFVIGAGIIFNEADKWDDLNWVDNWQINNNKRNAPGIQGGSNLNLEFDSIEITKDEVGGGLIYWNGKKYDYFHQTC